MLSADHIAHYKKNVILAYPVMLSQLGNVMVGFADNVMVGQVGVVPLAAASLTNAIFFLFLLFGTGVAYAMTPLVAAADGEGNSQKISTYFVHGLIINVVLAVVLCVVVSMAAPVMHLMDQAPEVVDLALPYLRIVALSYIPFLVFQTGRLFVEGLSFTRQAMVINVGGNVLNIVLNYLLIFGKLGFPAMGLYGAGIATLIARTAMAVAMMLYLLYAKRFARYRAELKGGFKVQRKTIVDMLKIGVPAGLQFIFESSIFGIAAIMMGWFGPQAQAAHQIAINMSGVTYMLASGISAVASIRVGNQLGKRDLPGLRRAGFTCFVLVTAFMFVCGVLFVVGRYAIPDFYVDDAAVIGLAAQLLIVAALFQVSDGLQVVGLGALRGIADVNVPTIFTLVAYWGIGLPMAYLLGFVWGQGPMGIWAGLLVGLTMAALMLTLRFNVMSKRVLT